MQVYIITGSGFSALPFHPPGYGPPGLLQKSMISAGVPCYEAPSDAISSGGVLMRGFPTQVDGFLMGATRQSITVQNFAKHCNIS